ncbi:MAG: inosine-5-monophosphate dehydrogenase [Planctomycetota bacterium]|nr:MAG: inosine-5-monophosphate dehydrogenase [Planctomycetota bacterium]
MLKAKDIMQSSLITVKEDTTVIEAINILGQNKITGLPVVDDDMNLLGLVSEKDVLSIAYRVLAGLVGDTMDAKKIGDIMTKDVVSFRLDDNLADICQCFMNNPFRRVPVLRNGKLFGIISRKDIIAHAFAALGNE